MQEILAAHPQVFSEELGTLQGYKATIHVELSAHPKFCKARSVPYAMQAKDDQELDWLVADGILEPVQYTEWAAPIIPILKRDQLSVHICGDVKQKMNSAAKVDHYPLPKIEDLFSELAGGQVFLKLDVSQAYQQVLLDEEPKKLVTLIYSRACLFQYTWLYTLWNFVSPGNFSQNIGKLVARDSRCDGILGWHPGCQEEYSRALTASGPSAVQIARDRVAGEPKIVFIHGYLRGVSGPSDRCTWLTSSIGEGPGSAKCPSTPRCGTTTLLPGLVILL